MRRKTTELTLALILLVSVSVLCGAGEPQGSEPGSLRFSWWGSDQRHEATLEVIELYQANNPDVTIEAEYSGFGGYLEKMITQLAAGSPPDIMQIDYAFLRPFWGQMESFVDFNQQDRIDMTGFPREMLAGIQAPSGELIGLPTGLNYSILFANKRLALQAGIDLTDQYTWEKVVEDAKKLRAAVPDAYLILSQIHLVNRYVFEPYLFNITGRPLVELDYSLGFNEDDVVQALEFVMMLYEIGALVPLDEIVGEAAASPYESAYWINDRALLMPDFSSGFTPAMATKDAGQVESLPPMGDAEAENTGIVLRPTNMLAASALSVNRDIALDFIDFFFNDLSAIDALEMVRSVPATTRALDRMVELDLLDPALRSVAEWAQTHKGGAGQNIVSTNVEFETIENDVLSALYYGDYTVGEAAEAFVEFMSDKAEELKESAGER